MSSAGEDSDAVLSDIEAEDSALVSVHNPSSDDVSIEKYRELLAELDHERQQREAIENSKLELQQSFNRLKILTHEAIKIRDESVRQREDALREKEELVKANEKLSNDLADTIAIKDDILRQKDDVVKQLDDMVKSRDSFRSEMETSTHMLVKGIEKVSEKVNMYKNFGAVGLPNSQKYTGLPSVAYGVIKRAHEIVEELIRHIDATAKSRDDTREQMEQRNYEIAIEVSQLEATIHQLREEISRKTSLLEDVEKSTLEKDAKISSTQNEMAEKLNISESEVRELKQKVSEYDLKSKDLESELGLMKPLLFDHLNLVTKIYDQLFDIINVIDSKYEIQSGLSKSLFLPQETNIEENIRASLAGLVSIYELALDISGKNRDLLERKDREEKTLNETVTQMSKEKERVGELLRNTLGKNVAMSSACKSNGMFDSSRDDLVGTERCEVVADANGPESLLKACDMDDNDIYAVAGALDNILSTCHLEIVDLKHTVEGLRAESSLLKEHLETHVKELGKRKLRTSELEERERVANENIEGLMSEVAAAEEEIKRWKTAAEQEAAAGRAVEQDLTSQISGIREELEEAREVLLEMEKKLKSKEEIAAAAMAARDAGEKSLRIVDTRASRLRDRVEELTHMLDEAQAQVRDGLGNAQTGPRYVCWPWKWLGLDMGGSRQPRLLQEASNEMELFEPLV